jgi:hypothetical protein
MAEWSWQVVKPSTGAHTGALTSATARKLTWQVDGAATASFTLPEAHPETAAVVELSRDVVVARNGSPLFRGRVGASGDTLNATAESVNFVANDYRAMLDRRIFWPTSTLHFTATDQADIAWQLIADTQAQPGGNWGVVRGAAATTGTARDRTYAAGNPVGTALGDLGRTSGGFDWEIDPLLRFNLFHPYRGRTTPVVLTYGRDIFDLKATVDPAKFATDVYFTGSNTTTPVSLGISTYDADVGRWDIQKSDSNALDQNTIQQRAEFELAIDSNLIPSYSVTLLPGTWDPAQLWLGDAVRLIAKGGRLNVDVTRRVMQIDVSLTDDGDEVVVLAIGITPLRLSDQLKATQAALTALTTGPYGTGPSTGIGGGGPGYGGPSGSPIPPGQGGVPPGGTTGQALEKASGTDFDTTWATVSGGGGYVAGGSAGAGGGTPVSITALAQYNLPFAVATWETPCPGASFGFFGASKLFLPVAGAFLVASTIWCTNLNVSQGHSYHFYIVRYNAAGATQIQMERIAYVPANVNSAQTLSFEFTSHVHTTATTDYVQFFVAPDSGDTLIPANPDQVAISFVSIGQV